jgi:rfaE bifunctional protein nucleotidyltransferase chain/domain
MRLGAVLDRPMAAQLAATYREHRKKVVLTNGCFDLMHVGHVRLLEAARSMGNVLIVGVNTDCSVRRRKGPSRPVVCEEERAEMLAALRYVDHVVLFDEDTADALVREIVPDIYVKGGDYQQENLIEASTAKQLGGQAVILPYTPDRSTTRLLQSVRKRQDQGSRSLVDEQAKEEAEIDDEV